MTKKSEQARGSRGDQAPERVARDGAIAARYEGDPSPRALYERGDIDREAYEGVSRLRAVGPPRRPFGDLIARLKAERERLGLSLADVAGRSGMDRAAVHKLEIGLNRNPTAETLTRYADALGKRIGWSVTDATVGPTPEAVNPHVSPAPAKTLGRNRRGTPDKARNRKGRTVTEPDVVRADGKTKAARPPARTKATSKTTSQTADRKAAKVPAAAKVAHPKAAARSGVSGTAKKKQTT